MSRYLSVINTVIIIVQFNNIFTVNVSFIFLRRYIDFESVVLENARLLMENEKVKSIMQRSARLEVLTRITVYPTGFVQVFALRSPKRNFVGCRRVRFLSHVSK